MKQTSFRISEETAALLTTLAQRFERSRTRVLELAIRVLARREGVSPQKGKRTMTDKNKTEIVVVMDESGSMASKREDVLGGFNGFVAEQKRLPGEALLTLVMFNTGYRMVLNGVPISDVAPLTPSAYIPGGNTALLAAVHKAITTTGARLAALPEEKRPGQVIVVIITDGEENSSGDEFPREMVVEMVQRQSEQYAWKFIYLGQGLDAFVEANGLGINASVVSNFVSGMAAGSKGIRAAYRAASYVASTSRSGGGIDHYGTQRLIDEDDKKVH